MDIFDAYKEMKTGKVIGMYDKNDILISRLKSCNNKLMYYSGSYFGWIESTMKFNDLLDYKFEEIDMYELDFISALEEMFKGKKIESEHSGCMYWIDKSTVRMRNKLGQGRKVHFFTEEIEGKWRVLE